jgi:hypothetical protein
MQGTSDLPDVCLGIDAYLVHPSFKQLFPGSDIHLTSYSSSSFGCIN